MRICLISLMKNEGPFILEWVAHWRNLGVTDFIIFSNDCFDGTDAILDRLDAMGVVQHLPNPAGLTGSTQFHRTALAYGAQLRRHREADYTMICDVDEFLHIAVPGGTLAALLEHNGFPDAISFSELLYGFGGQEQFTDGLVTERFTWSDDLTPGRLRARRGVKTLAKVSDLVVEWSNHRPRLENRKGIRWINGKGEGVPRAFRTGLERGFDVRGTYDQAWLAHYSVRSAESMLLKLDRGDAVRSLRMQPSYARKRSFARVRNTTLCAHSPAIRASMAELLADGELARLHAAAIEAHRARIAELKAAPAMAEAWEVIRAVCLGEPEPERDAYDPPPPRTPASAEDDTPASGYDDDDDEG